MQKKSTNLLKMTFVLFIVMGMFYPVYGQGFFNRESQGNRWTASWVSVPDAPETDYGLYYFRKELNLEEKPSQFIIQVSADNRYKLYVNEELVSLGPALGDIQHWD